MKLILDSKVLKQELPKFSNILKKTNLNYSDKILVSFLDKEVYLKGTNLDIYLSIKISGKIEEKGEILIPYQRLLDIVRLADSDLIISRLDNDWVQIVQGKSKNKVPSTSPSTMPKEPEVETSYGEVDAEKFVGLLKSVLFTSDSNSSVEVLRACNVNSIKGLLTLLTGDGLRFTKASGRFFKLKDLNCLIPKSGFEEVQKLNGTLKLNYSDNHIKFEDESRSLILRKLSSNYPDVSLAFKEELLDEIVLNKKDFELSIKKANQSTDDQHLAIMLNFTGEKLIINSTSSMYGEYVEEIPLKTVVKESFYVNGDFLTQFLANYDLEKFKLGISKNMFYFKHPDDNKYTHVLGLMRK